MAQSFRRLIEYLLNQARDWSHNRPAAVESREEAVENYRTCSTGDHEPSYVSNRRKNLAECHLYRLPPEVLLLMVGELPEYMKHVLRRTCGLFLGLVSYHDKKRAHYLPNGPFTIWPNYGSSADRQFVRRPVANLLARDLLMCRDCYDFRVDGRFGREVKRLKEALFCSACWSHHHLPFFSLEQRKVPDSRRVCIGTEGSVRLCRHHKMDWMDVISAAKRAVGSRDGHPLPCKDDGHDCRNVRKNTLARAMHRPYLKSVLYKEVDGPMKGFVVCRMTARPIELGPPEMAITRQSLQSLLVRHRESVEAVLCPHVAVDDGQLLLAFGSDQCACFETPRWISHDVARHRHGQTADTCCLCRGLRDPERQGLFMPAFSPSAGRDGEECEHKYDCFQCKATFAWRREGRVLYLEATKYLGCCPDDRKGGEAYFGIDNYKKTPGYNAYGIHVEKPILFGHEYVESLPEPYRSNWVRSPWLSMLCQEDRDRFTLGSRADRACHHEPVFGKPKRRWYTTARPTDEFWLLNMDSSPLRHSPELKHMTWCDHDKCWTGARSQAQLAALRDERWWWRWGVDEHYADHAFYWENDRPWWDLLCQDRLCLEPDEGERDEKIRSLEAELDRIKPTTIALWQEPRDIGRWRKAVVAELEILTEISAIRADKHVRAEFAAHAKLAFRTELAPDRAKLAAVHAGLAASADVAVRYELSNRTTLAMFRLWVAHDKLGVYDW